MPGLCADNKQELDPESLPSGAGLGEGQWGRFSLSPPYRGLTVQLGPQKGLPVGKALLNVQPAASEDPCKKGRRKDKAE